MKNLAIIVIVLIVLLGGWYWYAQTQSPAPAMSDTDSTTQDTSGTGNGSATVPSAAIPGNPVSDGSGHYIYTVTYNNGAFSPAVLTINHGDSIKWVNKDNLTMRVSASLTGTNPTPITDPNTQKTNGTYTLSFQQVGAWVIKNINDTAAGPGGSTVYVR